MPLLADDNSTGEYRANAASPQPTQKLSDIPAGPVYAADVRLYMVQPPSE